MVRYGQNLLGQKSLSKLGGWPDLTQIRFNAIVLAQPLHRDHRVMRVYASAQKASCQLAKGAPLAHWPTGDSMMLHQITTLLRMIHPSPTPLCVPAVLATPLLAVKRRYNSRPNSATSNSATSRWQLNKLWPRAPFPLQNFVLDPKIYV